MLALHEIRFKHYLKVLIGQTSKSPKDPHATVGQAQVNAAVHFLEYWTLSMFHNYASWNTPLFQAQKKISEYPKSV